MNECIILDEHWLLNNSVHPVLLSTGISVIMSYMILEKVMFCKIMNLKITEFMRKMWLKQATQNLCSFVTSALIVLIKILA